MTQLRYEALLKIQKRYLLDKVSKFISCSSIPHFCLDSIQMVMVIRPNMCDVLVCGRLVGDRKMVGGMPVGKLR